MPKIHFPAFLAFFTWVLIALLSSEVEGQSTTDDDSASCEFSTLDEAVGLIREELKDAQKETVDLIKEELMKNRPGSSPQQCLSVEGSGSKEAHVSSFLSSCVPLLIQQNLNGSDFFNRSWAEFKAGFNDSRGNYWLGNELLHQLTVRARCKLRFDLQTNDNRWHFAEYRVFRVFEESYNYTLHVSGFSGDTGDALDYQNGMMFTTYDRDNDPLIHSNATYKNNCAVYNGGGFWYKTCSYCSVNVIRGRGDSFRWHNSRYSYQLQSSRMWLMCN